MGVEASQAGCKRVWGFRVWGLGLSLRVQGSGARHLVPLQWIEYEVSGGLIMTLVNCGSIYFRGATYIYIYIYGESSAGPLFP